ncbi:MAG TPA: peptidase M61, partial [Rhodanobacteraceae bacterium]
MKHTFWATLLSMAALGAAPVAVDAADAADRTPYIGVNQPAPKDVDYPGTLAIHVDATDIAHRILTVNETIPVAGGEPVQLLYPTWIPGHHRPSGPIRQMAGLVIHGDDGQRLEWRRDPYNVYAFMVDVPAGVTALKVQFHFLAAQRSAEGPIRITPEMLDLSWEKISLYPAGYYARRIKTVPSVTLPAGWDYGSALEQASRDGDTVTFKPIDYLNLVDSPLYAGAHMRHLDLGVDGAPPVRLHVMGDTPRDIAVTDAQQAILKNLVTQMGKLYGAYHFDHYDFLLALSDKLTHKGLEHSRSSENATAADFFTDWKLARRNDLLSHEFNHSWNGKYRRGLRHATPDFNVPMGDGLMWVYEGQTQFYGNVVAVRAGLEDQATGFAKLADVAARYDRNRPGLASWRNVQDTTNDPTIAQRAPRPYRNYQGSEDYYAAGQLIWLAVDAKLRGLTKNQHNLDDFARAFFGVNPGAWDINTYVADDVYATLNQIAPYDWQAFLRSRLDGHLNLAEG